MTLGFGSMSIVKSGSSKSDDLALFLIAFHSGPVAKVICRSSSGIATASEFLLRICDLIILIFFLTGPSTFHFRIDSTFTINTFGMKDCQGATFGKYAPIPSSFCFYVFP